jgi:hypothetical protein
MTKRPWNEVQKGRCYWDPAANNGMGAERQHPDRSLKEAVGDLNGKRFEEQLMEVTQLLLQVVDAIEELDGQKKTKTIVDPPSGWKYGFPKELKDGVEYEDLLRSSGYPENDIPLALKHSRYWNE